MITSTTSTATATDDDTVILNGTNEALQAGEVINVYRDGVLIGVATSLTATTWELAGVTIDTESDNYTVKIADINGNTLDGTGSLDVALDTTAPAKPDAPTSYEDNIGNITSATSTASTTDDTQPGINVGTGLTDTPKLYIDGVEVLATYNSTTGTLTPNASLIEGTYAFTYTLTDAVGNESVQSDVLNITIDATDPSAPTVTTTNADELSGTAEAGSTVTLYDSLGNVVDTVVADASGNYSFAPNPLADGDTGTVTATDAAGNEGPATNVGPVDATDPTISIDATLEGDNIINGTEASTVIISGTTDAEDGQIVTIILSDGINTIIRTTAVSSGVWTTTDIDTSSLYDGSITVTANVSDVAGNEATEATKTLTKETGSLTITINDVATEDIINSSEKTAGVGISGTTNAEDGTTVTVSWGGVEKTTTASGGAWSVLYSSSDIPADTTNSTITAGVSDAFGNSGSTSTTVIIDTTAPILDINAPLTSIVADNVLNIDELNAIITDGQFTLSGTTTGLEAGQTVTVQLNNETYTGAAGLGGSWQVNIPSTDMQALAHGNDYIISAYTTDQAGNISVVDSETLQVRLAAPDTPIVYALNTNDLTPTITGTAAKLLLGAPVALGLLDYFSVTVNGHTYTYTVGTGSSPAGLSYNSSTMEWSLAVPSGVITADGTYDVAVSITAVGYLESKDDISTNELVVDTVPPSLTINDIATDNIINATEANNSLIVSGIADTTEAGRTVQITGFNGQTYTATVQADGSWSTIISSTDVAATTTGTIGASLVDIYGNTATDNQALVVDKTSPTATVMIESITSDNGTSSSDFATNDNTLIFNISLTGTLGSGENVQISLDNGTSWHEAGFVSGSTYAYDNTGSTMSDGSYSVLARVIDTAGNTNSLVNQTVVIDNTPPTTNSTINSYVDDIGTITSTTSTATITDDNTVALHGTNEALEVGEVINVYRDSVLIGVATSLTSTTWELAGVAIDTESDNYTVKIADAAGNTNNGSGSLDIALDTTPPNSTVSIDSYTDNVGASRGDFGLGTTTDDRITTLNGTITGTLESGDTVRIYQGATLLGNATVVGSSWTYNLPQLSDGITYTYHAVVADSSGNEGTLSSNFAITVDLAVIVESQSTLDITPIVTGSVGFEILSGEYFEITINGVTYSSQTGDVVVDSVNNTWYVQIPDANTLTAGTTYNVAAVLKDSGGNTVTTDNTTGELVIGTAPAAPTVPASTDAANKATALTLGEDGLWRIFSNMTMLDQSATNITNTSSFSSNTLYGNNGVMGVASFIDFDRDGDMDLAGEDSTYIDGQQAFENKGSGYTQSSVPGNTTHSNSEYYAFLIGDESSAYSDRVDHSGSSTLLDYGTSANTYSWYGGTALYDKTGDGYVDIVYGDDTPNDEESQGGYDTSFVNNNSGTFSKDGTMTYSAAYDWAGNESGQATPEKEVSTVDLNNDGAVDIVFHANAGSNNITGNGTNTYNNGRLVVATNSGSGNLDVTEIIENVFYANDGNTYDGVSMTWADYNNDGYLDLFLGYNNSTTNSKIYYNDGTGKLSGVNSDADPIYENAGTTYTMGDGKAGGGSVAVDWNMDGKTDIIEIPYYTGSDPASAQSVLLFTNNTSGSTNSFAQTTLATVADSGAGSAITGLLAFDMDWDGDKDLMLFTGTKGVTYKENTNTVADGTVLHLKILDQGGINALYGNTVKLYNSVGVLVATQIINPQSGNQTSDSSALVDFYGLDPNETYTAVLLRNINGVSQDVGGVASIGGFTIENVNTGWTNLTTDKAYDSYVLTAESGSAVNNASSGNGIIGTGYNDTFIATGGTDKFEGSGGSVEVSGSRQWSNIGGEDIVDYINAGSTAITVDLSNVASQNTGFGTHTFSNIEGIAGASGADTFTDSSTNNIFNGRGGNDTINLSNGGHDTLIYEAITDDNIGGNGNDIINDFWVGTYEATANADRIDISDLLVGYTADSNGPAHYINGTPTLDSGETITDYISLQNMSGDSAELWIDRDGSGGVYNSELLMTINFSNVTPDADTLTMMLANHQFVL